MAGSEIAPGVHRLGTSWINWYLVVSDDGITLVDTAVPGYFDQLAEKLGELGRTLGEIDSIVITHHHTDHTGCAERIRQEAQARVLVPEAEAPVIRGERKGPAPSGLISNAWRPVLMRFLVHALRNGGASFDAVGEVETYGGGETLDVPGKPRAISTPGHSFGHCAISFPAHGVLFAGDAMASVGWVSGSTDPQRHPFNEDYEQAAHSLAHIEAEQADLIAFGHGDPFRGTPAEAVARARAALT